jgi:hypothetical protein
MNTFEVFLAVNASVFQLQGLLLRGRQSSARTTVIREKQRLRELREEAVEYGLRRSERGNIKKRNRDL